MYYRSEYTLMLGAVGNLGVNAFFITKTPQNIVARLTKEIVQILNRPDANEAVLKQGMVIVNSSRRK